MSNRGLLSIICSLGRQEPQNASKKIKFTIFLFGEQRASVNKTKNKVKRFKP
jgi:hypothetical protein